MISTLGGGSDYKDSHQNSVEEVNIAQEYKAWAQVMVKVLELEGLN
jgi:hypothetical protein